MARRAPTWLPKTPDDIQGPFGYPRWSPAVRRRVSAALGRRRSEQETRNLIAQTKLILGPIGTERSSPLRISR
jgi:hypothetical protein